RAGRGVRDAPGRRHRHRPQAPARSALCRRAPQDRAATRRDRRAHPCRRHGEPAAAAPPRGGGSGRRIARGPRLARPAAAGVRAGTLLARPAPTARPRLVHGDFRTGNYLADESGVTAILDWEGAHLGDPIEDLGWVCVKSWRFGSIDKPAGGFGSREDLWSAYRRAGGAEIDRARAHWWEVFGTVRWGVICLTQAWRHLSGSVKSMELASIGRRAVETEVDLLQLLKEAR